MENKISFKDLTIGLKTTIVAMWVIIGMWIVSFLVGFIVGLIGGV